MPPRITLLTSASANSGVRTWSAHEQHSASFSANGKDAQVVVNEADELSEMDEASAQEIDELDESDSGPQEAQPQWETISSASAGAAPSPKAGVKRPRQKPPTTRQPGQTIVPVSRIEAIVSAGAVHHGNFWTTSKKETSFLISLATEEFIRRLTRVAHSRSCLDKRPLTTYNDFADSAYYFDEYKFLQEIVPRPVSLQFALSERKRICEEHDALLNGLNITGVEGKTKIGKASASTSKASTPVPRISKAKITSANGKTSSKVKNANPAVRSERQKNKKARIAKESHQPSREHGASSNLAPSPSPAQNGHAPRDVNATNGSNNSSRSGSMKIKIRPRTASSAPIAVPVNAVSPSQVLPLGPLLQPSSADVVERWHQQQRDDGNSDAPLRFEEDAKSGAANGSPNEKAGSVQFAPVGVEATDQPLWTRVPLPPPPSAKVTKIHSTRDHSKNDDMVTDLDSLAEQARTSGASKPHSIREDSGSGPPQDESKEAMNGNEIEHAEPPSKRPRQRQRSGESTSGKGGPQDALNGNLPNPGRTIYSQR